MSKMKKFVSLWIPFQGAVGLGVAGTSKGVFSTLSTEENFKKLADISDTEPFLGSKNSRQEKISHLQQDRDIRDGESGELAIEVMPGLHDARASPSKTVFSPSPLLLNKILTALEESQKGPISYRKIKIQLMKEDYVLANGPIISLLERPYYFLVYLVKAETNGVEFAKIELEKDAEILDHLENHQAKIKLKALHYPYSLTKNDMAQQKSSAPSRPSRDAPAPPSCPDPETTFVIGGEFYDDDPKNYYDRTVMDAVVAMVQKKRVGKVVILTPLKSDYSDDHESETFCSGCGVSSGLASGLGALAKKFLGKIAPSNSSQAAKNSKSIQQDAPPDHSQYYRPNTIDTWMDYMVCPKLRGIHIASPGNKEGWLVKDGYLNAQIFNNLWEMSLQGWAGMDVHLLSTSDQVFGRGDPGTPSSGDHPLRDAIALNRPRVFLASQSKVLHLFSPLTTQCLWERYFTESDRIGRQIGAQIRIGAQITPADLQSCIEKSDPVKGKTKGRYWYVDNWIPPTYEEIYIDQEHLNGGESFVGKIGKGEDSAVFPDVQPDNKQMWIRTVRQNTKGMDPLDCGLDPETFPLGVNHVTVPTLVVVPAADVPLAICTVVNPFNQKGSPVNGANEWKMWEGA